MNRSRMSGGKSPSEKSSGSRHSSTTKTPKLATPSRSAQKQNSQKIGRFIETALASPDAECAGDECGQIANEMILIVYEKIEKVKSQIKAQAETKRKLELELVKHEEGVKDTKEMIRKLERDQAYIVTECEQLEKDIVKFDKSLEEAGETAKKAAKEQLDMVQDMGAKIAEAKGRVEKEKIELLEARDKEIPVENGLALEKELLEGKIHDEDRILDALQKEVRLARLKEDARLKKFKSRREEYLHPCKDEANCGGDFGC